MNYTVIKQLPLPEDLIHGIPLSKAGYQKIIQDRNEIQRILEGKDDRLILIIGPCSAWPKEAVLTFAKKLLELNQKVSDTLKIVMRVYIQKPRTTKGWTGPVNQPDPLSFPDIEAGMKYTRDMMIQIIEMGLPIADESLFTHNANVFQELLAWVAIGARSSEDQEHRIFASAMDCPVGLKNPTHGNCVIGVNGVLAAQHSHVAVFDGYEIQTHGNPYAHLVLRGGNGKPNYSNADLTDVKNAMDKNHIKNPAVLVDVSHDNCLVNGKKDYHKQPDIIMEILDNIKDNKELKNLVKGFMVESFMKEGRQDIHHDKPELIDHSGLSITDPCLGWEKTEELLLGLHHRRKSEKA